jgi:hypothetical protein
LTIISPLGKQGKVTLLREGNIFTYQDQSYSAVEGDAVAYLRNLGHPAKEEVKLLPLKIRKK